MINTPHTKKNRKQRQMYINFMLTIDQMRENYTFN